MSAFVTAGSEDANVKYLQGALMNAMKDLLSKKKKGSALTIEDFINVHNEIIKENVGMYNYFDQKLGEAHDEIKSLKDTSKSQGDELINVKKELVSTKKELVSTKLELERSQQHANRDTFKLCGIKEPTNLGGGYENTQDTVIKALETANVQIKKEEISASYRVPGKPDGPKNLLIKCSLQDVKDRVMRNKKILRACEDFQKEYPNAYIVEQLTPLRSKVAYMLRQDNEKIEKVWTIGGRIKYILAGAGTGEKPKTIDSLSQLKLVPGWDEEKIEKLVLGQLQ